MLLGEIANIQPGLPFRSRIEPEADGALIAIQARNLGDDGQLRLESVTRLRSLPALRKEGFLRAGDILLQPRGARFPAAMFKRAELPAIAVAPLLVLRADSSRIMPEFLLAVLMSPATQALLRQFAVGTYVPQVPRQAIESLRIELPELSSQIKLADLACLERQERKLTDRLREVRARFFDLVVREVARADRPSRRRIKERA